MIGQCLINHGLWVEVKLVAGCDSRTFGQRVLVSPTRGEGALWVCPKTIRLKDMSKVLGIKGFRRLLKNNQIPARVIQ